jgi:hypothetical protein
MMGAAKLFPDEFPMDDCAGAHHDLGAGRESRHLLLWTREMYGR